MQIEATTEPSTETAPIEAQAVSATEQSAAAETAAPAETTTEASAEQSTQQAESDRDDQGRFKSKIQKRIDDLTHARHAAEREAARWRAIAEGNQTQAAPNRNDYATDEEYNDALIDHRIETRAGKVNADSARQMAQQSEQDAQRATAETYNQRVQATAARIPDFAEVVGKANIQITDALRDALMDSEHGPDIVYQLAKNPEEAARLSNMSVRQLDREIGRMEAAIGSKPAPTPPAARTTNAPPPARPNTPAAAPANTDPSRMSMDEYEAWRRAQGSRYIR